MKDTVLYTLNLKLSLIKTALSIFLFVFVEAAFVNYIVVNYIAVAFCSIAISQYRTAVQS